MFKGRLFINDFVVVVVMAIVYSTISSFLPVSYPQYGFLYTPLRYFLLNSPVILLFLFFRICKVRTFSAMSLTVIIVGILLAINYKKMRLTGIPLSFNDLVATSQFSVVIKYVPLWAYLVIIAAVSLLFLLARLEKRWRGKEPFHRIYAILLILIMPFTFFIYQNGSLSFIQDFAVRQVFIFYNNYMPKVNISHNGLLMHLIQTSARKFTPTVSLQEKQQYQQFYQQAKPQGERPKTVIYILCESCWYNKDHFSTLFTPLLKQGFEQSRGLSPVYGGNTANAEFEMLTGLPSHTAHLSGIIYQEYGTVMSAYVDALPQVLRKVGYITYAAHDNDKGAWNRNTVYPKLGISRFQGLSDMSELASNYTPAKSSWRKTPDDIILYKTAIQALKQAKGQHIFMQLVTMSTHGPYEAGNDDGKTTYSTLLAESADRLQDFAHQVLAIDPSATIVIYGDHKPALNDFFIKNKILPVDFFAGGPAVYGDIPVLIKSENTDAVRKVIQQSKGKPLFCVTSAINNNLLHVPLFSNSFYQENGCLDPHGQNYQALVDKMPGWVIGMALFKNELTSP